jgi:hypothetical protein
MRVVYSPRRSPLVALCWTGKSLKSSADTCRLLQLDVLLSQTVSSSLQEEEKGDGPFRKRSKQSGRHSASEWWLDDDLEYGSTDMRYAALQSFGL